MRVRGQGRIFQRGTRWWIAYYRRGKEYRESAGTSRKDATGLLKQRLSEIQSRQFVEPEHERLTVSEMMESYDQHLLRKGVKALRGIRTYLRLIQDMLGPYKVADVTTGLAERWQDDLQRAGYAPGSIGVASSYLRAALRLMQRQERLWRAPHIPTVTIKNARQGFFEPHEVRAVLRHLSDPIRDLVEFHYLTGWRRQEAMGLRWEAIDRAGGQIILGDSKNGDGRVVPLTAELAEIIDRRWTAREYRRPDGTTGLAPWVFHRRGRPVRDYAWQWRSACAAAGLSGRLIHDFRRTAVRDMVRAGVPETVAMKISGHRSRQVFERYNITSARDQAAALEATSEYRRKLLAQSDSRTEHGHLRAVKPSN